MKCRECPFMSDLGGGLYWCAQMYCEDQCDDGEYNISLKQEVNDDKLGSD